MMKKRPTNPVKVSPLVLIVSFFWLLVIAGRTAQLALLSTIDGINIQKFATSRTTRKQVLVANRGNIFDINGNILAQNVSSYTVIAYLDENRSKNQVRPQHVVDKEHTAKQLAPILKMSEESIYNLLNRKNVTQVELGPGGRGITELTKEAIIALELPGIDFSKSYKRYYPNGRFLSYTLGYAKSNNQDEIYGELGLEAHYNDKLKGTNGYLEFQADSNGYQIPNTNEKRIEPVDGHDLYLTIDNNIQLFVEKALSENYDATYPEWLLMVVADAKTGQILASTSYPSFDPNIRDITSYLDPVVSYAYEPGSTMKIFTYMATMENNSYRGNDTFPSGSIRIGEYTVRDWNTYGWGNITYDLGFCLSSNVGVSHLVDKNINRFILRDYLLKMGFGKVTGIELPREVPGKINFKYKIEVANAAFGQGITITPIQMIQALTAIANEGMMLKPYLVDKIVNPDTNEIIHQGLRTELHQVANQATIKKIKELMYNVIHNDSSATTGSTYKVEGLDLIGKTGTAQIADGKGGYMSNTFISSFAGLYPKDDPKLIIYTVARGGTRNTIISSVKRVVMDTAKYLNIKQTNNDEEKIINYVMPSFLNKEVSDVKNTLRKENIYAITFGDGDKIIRQYPNAGSIMSHQDLVFLITNESLIKIPNMYGWSSREVLTFTKLFSIKCELDGYGYVVSQNIPPGSLLDEATNLIIELQPKYDFKDT